MKLSLPWVLGLCLLFFAASPLLGQFNPDRWRERQKWLPAWLDDTDPKTWFWHSAISVGGGYALAAITPMGPATGMRVFVAAYFVREVLARTARRPLRFNYRHKPLDGVLDFALPLTVVEVWVRL